MKKQLPFFIKKIYQKDNFHFIIEWNDDKMGVYRLSNLQKLCPCASCIQNFDAKIDENVKAFKIQNVGRYALKIDFSSGCSKGIFSFDYLREHFPL